MGVPSVRKWLASSLPLDANSEPWLRSTNIYHQIYPNNSHSTSSHEVLTTGMQSHNTPHKHDLGSDPKQLVQNSLNLNGSDPLAWSDKGPLFVSNVHQSLERREAIRTFLLYCNSYAVYHICRTVPVGSPCEWAQAALRSLAAGTRSRWSGVSDKHSPSHCHPCGPACSGDSCRSPGPSTPWEKTHTYIKKRQIKVTIPCRVRLSVHFQKRRVWQTLIWWLAEPFHCPGWDAWGPDEGFWGNHLCRAHWESGKHWLS